MTCLRKSQPREEVSEFTDAKRQRYERLRIWHGRRDVRDRVDGQSANCPSIHQTTCSSSIHPSIDKSMHPLSIISYINFPINLFISLPTYVRVQGYFDDTSRPHQQFIIFLLYVFIRVCYTRTKIW